MIRHKWISTAAVLLMAASVLILGFLYMNPSALASVAEKTEPPYTAAIDKSKIMDIQIIAEEKDWEEMLENAAAEEYIPATIIIDGVRIENAGIRPKGNSSLSTVAQDDTTDRFSFKIEFDHYITGQTWKGLDKLVVNNMQSDAAYMKEYLSYDIMDYIGVETPEFAFADISVNGETWGFYLAVEALEDSFAERVYGQDHGQLYKPESMGMRGEGKMNDFIRQNGEEPPGMENPGGRPDGQERGMGGMKGMASNGVSLEYTDDDVSSYSAVFDNAVFKAGQSDYMRVIQSLEKLAKGEDLENAVDVEAVLQYFAAQTVVVNLDSYNSVMGHNYYLYEEEGRLTILPWDYNLAFGGFQSGDAGDVVNFPIDTPVSGVSLEDRPLLGKLLEVPEYLDQYHSYLRQITDGYFNSGTFSETIDYLNSLISSHVENDPSAFYTYEAYQTAVTELKKLGLLRAESIEGQLNGTVPSTGEGQSAAPDKLVDASGAELSLLGGQGGGMAFGGKDGMKFPDMEDMETMQNQERAREEAEVWKEMEQGGPGGRRPDGLADNPGKNPGFPQEAENPGYASYSWIILGGSLLLLFGGLLFTALFQRRRRIS